MLKSNGVDYIHLPLIRFEGLELPSSSYDFGEVSYLLFSSRTPLKFLDIERIKSFKGSLFSIGKATTETLKSNGIKVDWECRSSNVMQMAIELGTEVFEKGRIRHFCSEKTFLDPVQFEAMSIGFKVENIPAYRTIAVLPEESSQWNEVRQEEELEVVFYSPSAVHAFFEYYHSIVDKIQTFYSVGPTTTVALKKQSVKDIVQAAQPNDEEVLDVILKGSNS